MVKSGKLLSTTNEETVFKAPFVYAIGVRTEESKQAISDAKSQLNQLELMKRQVLLQLTVIQLQNIKKLVDLRY